MDQQESFINYLKYEKRYSSHTIKAYKNDLDQFVYFCTMLIGDFNVDNIDNKKVRLWIADLNKNGTTARSIKRKLSTIRVFFKYLNRENYIVNNPCNNLIQPKTNKKLPYFVEEENMAHLFDDGLFENNFKGIRDKTLLMVLYCCGIRRSELINLEVKNINLTDNYIKVRGKGNKERIVPFPRNINDLITQYLSLRNEVAGNDEGWFMVTDNGEQLYENFVYRIVKKNLAKVTLIEKKSPHVIRHSYATHLLNRGADLQAVRELLGHSNLAATQIYTHTSVEKLYKIYKQAHPRG